MFRNLKKCTVAAVICASVFMYAAASESASSAFVEACRAYSKGDWSDAKFMLKKAVSYKENLNPDTYYMLIMAEVYDGDSKSALDDCNFFLDSFPTSLYYPRVYYQKGKLLYSLGEYEKSIVVLSDFCHRNEDDELYPLALFYIAECLFTDYKYEEAEAIYERIVVSYPSCEKVAAAQYRIENIAQRSREEKLLYLLKQTGEEYLAAKEDYEKQLRLYNSEAINTTRERLADAQQKNRDLEEQIAELEAQINTLKEEQELQSQQLQAAEMSEQTDDTKKSGSDNSEAIRILKAKAFLIQRIMDKQQAEAVNDQSK